MSMQANRAGSAPALNSPRPEAAGSSGHRKADMLPNTSAAEISHHLIEKKRWHRMIFLTARVFTKTIEETRKILMATQKEKYRERGM